MKERTIQVALFILFAITTTPVALQLHGYTLDASWVAALNWAVDKNIEFGKDIVFTYGPLGFIGVPGKQFLIAFIYNILLSLLLLPFFKIKNIVSIIFCLIFILTTSMMGILNSIQYLLPIIMILFAFKAKEDKRYYIYMVATILVTIPMIFIKFNNVALLLFSVIIVDIVTFKESKKIFATPIFIVWLILLWILIGQPIENLPTYFKSSLEIMNGYNDAMISGYENFPTIDFFTVLFLITLTIFHTIKYGLKKIDGNLRKILLLLSILAPLFVAFKYGFVRHDSGHVDLSYFTIININAFMAITIYREELIALMGKKYIKYIGLALGIFCLLYILFKPDSRITKKIYTLMPSIEKSILALTGNMNGELYQAKKSIAFYNGMFDNETIDSYPYYQGAIIASNLNYKPRPVIQSYSAYTKELREINSLSLLKDDAPENILFAVQEIDKRLPTSMDSPSWVHILNRYELVNSFNKIGILELHFKKKNKDKFDNLTFKEISSNEYNFNTAIEVPKNQPQIFVSMELKKNLFNKLISFLFRGITYKINLTLVNGQIVPFKIVSGMVQTPVLLSPLVYNTESFLDFYNGKNPFLVDNFSIAPEFPVLTKNGSTAFEKFITNMMTTNTFELKFYTLGK